MREEWGGEGRVVRGEEQLGGRNGLGAGKSDSNWSGVVVAGARWIFSCCNVCTFGICSLN